MVGFGTSLLEVDVKTPPNRNIRDIVERLRERAAVTPLGDWVRGRGYDDTGLEDMRHPNRNDLDDVSTEHPIMIVHNSGHMLAANSRALEMANIHAETPDPPGGRIGRFPGSPEPDGMLYETAQSAVQEIVRTYDEQEIRNGFIMAQDEYLRQGVTTIHDAGVGRGRGVDILKTYQTARREGFLKFRVNMFIIYALLKELDFALQSGFGDEWVRVAGCKIVSDGSIQGITAALREPYFCDDSQKGWLIYEQEELNEMVMTLHERGYQIATHANGDAAIDSTLMAYENALSVPSPRPITASASSTARCVTPSTSTRCSELGVIPDFFANHVFYWGDRHRDRFLGPDRVRNLDPVGSAVHAGIKPLLHSDCPVTPVSPLFCIQSAAARVTSSGEILNDPERITVRQAIETMTVNAARGSFEEDVKGSLELGKLGDLVVLNQDPFAEAPKDIGQIEVAATVVGGQVMHNDDEISIG